MRLFGSERIAKMMDRMGHKEGEVIQHSMITKSIERAQKKVEENNFGTRKRLLEYDDVMNKQRDVIYKRRKNALFGDHLKYDITNMILMWLILSLRKEKLQEIIKILNTKSLKHLRWNLRFLKMISRIKTFRINEYLIQSSSGRLSDEAELIERKIIPNH
jgi:preprotein translocase subunit SecA